MEFQDYYATLGVKKDSSDKEVKQAYRKLARTFHPDVNPNDTAAETRFKQINEAYEVLGDAEKRRKYDELGANWRLYEQAQQSGQDPVAGGFPFGAGNWSVHFGGAGSAPNVHEVFGDEDPFSDFFQAFFGGGASTRRRTSRAPRSRRGRDVEHPVDLSLEEAFHGVKRRLSISTRGHARTLDVRIPAGVADGSRVRIAGEGEVGTGTAAAGDVFLRIRIAPHARFQQKGRDLYLTVTSPLTTAVLGGTVDVLTIDRRPLQLKVPPSTQPGQVFRLKGQGMPATRKPVERGDLYATLDVRVPTELTAEQRRHYEALAMLDANGAPAKGNRQDADARPPNAGEHGPARASGATS